MELLVKDTNFKTIAVVEWSKSILWIDRYCGAGEFEIYCPLSDAVNEYLKEDYYLIHRDSKHTMIIESRQLTENVEEGDTIVIKGRSLESILERRIVWEQTNFAGEPLQASIMSLIDAAIINPTDSTRAIPNFITSLSSDPAIVDQPITGQYFGRTMYDVVVEVCKKFSLGFRIYLTDQDQFEFALYIGEDRSSQQSTNLPIKFSPYYDNINNSEHFIDKRPLKTVTLVAGEGEGTARVMVERSIPSGSGSGLNRRELYTDARDISKTTDEGTLNDAEYTALLISRGVKTLSEAEVNETFEGEADTTRMYKYQTDFHLGDIVETANRYGATGRTRITEYRYFEDPSGLEIYPSFEKVD